MCGLFLWAALMLAGSLQIELSANVARLAKDMADAKGAVGNATAAIERSVAAAKQAFAGLGLGLGLAQIIALTDQYMKFTAQLKLATTSTVEYAKAQADVRRIAKDAQTDLAATGVLYARITNGTRELGISQQKVADITESVSLALKVSNATTSESASAMLQLSQSFASGTLRGEEFNAVNEAAPRLMKALADGMGVPVGALKEMASEGKITSAILSQAIPSALKDLRKEAEAVQTIGGAFTVLKNNVMEFVGVQAQASGTVSMLTSGIGFLANNLQMVVGVIATLTAVKFVTWLAEGTAALYAQVAASQAKGAATLAAARADVVATGAAVAHTVARVAELRSAVVAAEGNVALAVTLNGLIPAQTKAATAAAAHTAALSTLAVAQRAASVAGGVVSGAMGILGGPISWITLLLGLGATAWQAWGSGAKDSEVQASAAVRESTAEIMANLDTQIKKLQERNELARSGLPEIAKGESSGAARMAELLAELKSAQAGAGKFAGLDDAARTDVVRKLGEQYGALYGKIQLVKTETEKLDAFGKQTKAGEWAEKYASKAEKLAAELKKAQKELGSAFTPEMEKRIRDHFETKDAGVKKELTGYTNLMTAINERLAEQALEIAGTEKLSESQKLAIDLQEGLRTGKIKMTSAHEAEYRAALKKLEVGEKEIASIKAVAKAVEESNKRAAEGAAAMAKMWTEFSDAQQKSVDAAVKEAEANEDLVRTFGMTKGAIEAVELARLEEQLAQRSSTGLTLDEIETLEKLIEAKKRNAGAQGTLDQLEAQKKVAKDAETEWKRVSDSIESSLTDALMRGFESGKDFASSLLDTLKNMFKTLVLRPTIQAILAPIAGGITSMMPGAAQAAGSVGTSVAGSLFSSFIPAGVTSMLGSVGQGVSAAMAAGQGIFGSFSTGLASLTGGIGSAATSIGMMIPAIGAVVAGLVILANLLEDGPEENTTFTLGSSANKMTNSVDTGRNQSGGNYVGGAGVNTAFGSVGITDQFWIDTIAAQNRPATEAFLQSLKKSDDRIAGFLSEAEKAAVTAHLNNTSMTAQTGPEGSDPSKAFPEIFAGRMKEILKGIEPGLESLIEGFKGSGDQLQAEVETLLAIRKNIDQASKTFGEPVTLQGLATAFEQFKQDGETTGQVIMRMGATFTLTSEVATLLGKTSEQAFGAVGLASAEARAALVKAAGGIDAFAAQTANFVANFYTDAERGAMSQAAAQKSLDETFGKLGISIPNSTEEFRALMAAQDLSTESGRATYQSLMNASGAFVAVKGTAQQAAEAAARLANSIGGIMDTIAQLNGVAPTNTALSTLAGMNKDWGSLANLLTVSATDLANMTQAQRDLIQQALNWEAQHRNQGGAGSGGGSSGGTGAGGGSSEATQAISNAFEDLMKSVASDIAKFTQDLANLSKTTYEVAIQNIRDAAADKLASLNASDQTAAIASMRAGAKAQAQASFDAFIQAGMVAFNENNPLGLLPNVNDFPGYQAALDAYNAAMKAAGALTIDNTAVMNEWIQAQIDLLNAQNKIKAAAITGDLGKQIERTGMTPLEIQIADINEKAQDYLKSLADLGQTTAANTAEVERWRQAMLAMIEAKGAIDVMKDLVVQIDKIANFSAGIRSTIDDLRAAGPGFDNVAATAAKVSKTWRDLSALGPDASTDDRLAAAGKVKEAIMANYNAELTALQKNQSERMKGLEDRQSAEKEAFTKIADNMKAFGDALKGIADYAKSLVLGEMTTLSPLQKMAEAQRQYATTLAAAQGGDAVAAGKLQGISDVYLKSAQGVYASSGGYADIFAKVLGDLTSLGGLGVDVKQQAEDMLAVKTLEWQKEITDLQKVFDAETLALQNRTIAELQRLADITDAWQGDLVDQLTEQAIAFSHLNMTADQIALLLTGVDARIGEAVALAMNSMDYAFIHPPEYQPISSNESGSSNAETVAELRAQTKAMEAQAEATEAQAAATLEQNKLLETLIVAVDEVKEGGDANAREAKQVLITELRRVFV